EGEKAEHADIQYPFPSSGQSRDSWEPLDQSISLPGAGLRSDLMVTYSGSSLSRRIAVSAPPHTQPVSIACTPRPAKRPSVDQWPHTTRMSRLTWPGTSNQG